MSGKNERQERQTEKEREREKRRKGERERKDGKMTWKKKKTMGGVVGGG